ncbi:MAG TPA: hypothetical protein DCP84_08340 [Pseudomonas sp.]|nr:hypothetical protein [Pseudomonas sp.]
MAWGSSTSFTLSGRALNKNKKPAKKNNKSTRNDFLGSLGSPCRFCLWAGILRPPTPSRE